MGNVSPSDSMLAQCVGSPAPVDHLFEIYKVQLHRSAAKMFPDDIDARQAWVLNKLEFLTGVYRLAQEFAPDNVARVTEYLYSRPLVFLPHLTVQ